MTFNSFEKIGAQTELGQEVARIKNEYGKNLNVQSLDFQYKKLIQDYKRYSSFEIDTGYLASVAGN